MKQRRLGKNGPLVSAIGLGRGSQPVQFDSPLEKAFNDTIHRAVDLGINLFDTAAAYGNERQVGEGLRASGVPREDVFVETKIWVTDYGRDETLHAFEMVADTYLSVSTPVQVAAPATLAVYVEDASAIVEALSLLPSSVGTNVVLSWRANETRKRVRFKRSARTTFSSLT